MTKTINALTVATSAAAGDFLPIWRAANGDTRKITKTNFLAGLDTEVVAARTAINYSAGTPPDALGDALNYAARNVYNVMAYGATGDGVTDDAAAIQAAVDAAIAATPGAGGTVVIPGDKTFIIGDQITLDGKVTVVIERGAVVKAKDGGMATNQTGEDSVSASFYMFLAVGQARVNIINYGTLNANYNQIVNTAGQTGGSCIGLFECEQCYVHLGYVRDCNIGCITVDCDYCTIENGLTDNPTNVIDALVAAEGSHHCIWQNLIAVGTNEVMDMTSRNIDCIINNVLAINTKDQVIDINQSRNITVSNVNIKDHTGNDGIMIRGVGSGRWSKRDEFGNSDNVIIQNVTGNVSTTTPDTFITILAGPADQPRLEYSGTHQDFVADENSPYGETVTGGTSGATGKVWRAGATTNYVTLIDVVGTFQVGEVITGATSGATATLTVVWDFYTCHNVTIENIKCLGAYRGIDVGQGSNAGESAVDGLTIRDAEFSGVTEQDIRYIGQSGEEKRLTIERTSHVGTKAFTRIQVETCKQVQISGVNVPNTGNATDAIKLTSCPEFEISSCNLKADDTALATSGFGIVITNCLKGVIRDCFISNFDGTDKAAIALVQGSANLTGYVTILNCQFEDNKYVVWDSTTAMDAILIAMCVSISNTNFVRTIAQYRYFGISSDTTSYVATVGTAQTFSNKTLSDSVFTGLTRNLPGTATIAAGAITVTSPHMRIDTEAAAATDDLDNINGGADGMIVYIMPTNSSRDIVIRNAGGGTGNIRTSGALDRTLANRRNVWCGMYVASESVWVELFFQTGT